jgi:catechol 2,3-dioxygenase-like lactoylglutathione lyase family enzyme
MTLALSTVIIYAKDMLRTARFYSEHFGYETSGEVCEGLIELRPAGGGAEILIHQAAKSLKLGSASIKLSFAVPDVRQFVEDAKAKGLAFGAVHQANGYEFANVKDPDGHSISVSSRHFRE